MKYTELSNEMVAYLHKKVNIKERPPLSLRKRPDASACIFQDI